jgi:hypothetical protein
MNSAFAYSRRHFIKVAAAGLALARTVDAKINSRINGVYIGLQSFSLRTLPHEGAIDVIVGAMKKIGIGECEITSAHVEPDNSQIPDIRKWRATVSLDYFQKIRRQFNQEGLSIYSYSSRIGGFGGGGGRGARGAAGPAGASGNQSSGSAAVSPPTPPAASSQPPFTDEEINRCFVIAKALGAKTISSGLQPDLAKRVAPIAEKHKMVVGVSATNPDTFAEILQISPYFKMDIDIGDVTHAGYDPFPFIQANYHQITDIHLKDSKFKGPSTPFGEGDAHMKDVLLLLKKQKSQIRAHIDCTYPGTGSSVEEVQKCFDYIKNCLA